MIEPKIAPYGSWKSPITSALIVSETTEFGQIGVDGEDVYWVELRPSEGGRYVVVRCGPEGQVEDVTPPPFNVRTRVHEYGGGAFVAMDDAIFFSNDADQRLYRQDPGTEPRPITPEMDLRYADGVFDGRRNRMICVREDHTVSGREAVNTLVGVGIEGCDGGEVLASGDDFYASPRISPDGTRLAWLTWNHPNMPWNGTELWVAQMEADGSLGRAERVAGDIDESIFQPEWSPDGILHFVSDRTGWWNLYRWRDGRIEPLHDMEAEFGVPQWIFGLRTYGFVSEEEILCAYTQQGAWFLARLNTRTGVFEEIEVPYTRIRYLNIMSGRATFLAGSPTEETALVQLDLATREIEVLRRSSEVEIDPGYLSVPRAIEFPTEQGLTAHAFFYAPQNRDYAAPSNERPPLLVKSHGGPTGTTSGTLDLEIQYWTSRGIAILDVNYGGSVGYGRAYWERLDGTWGIVDVNDCVNGACYLVEQGEADGDRLAIRGGSAGGYTTLAALAFRDVFGAGASYFGVSDLEALTRETHKFESRYLDRLIGPYPARRDLYLERSPIHFTDRISCPMILLQGLEDKVVLPNQAEMMVDALRAKGLPVAYLAFEGEQHGFRHAETIKRTLDAELYFYGRIFGFELADPVEPVEIENL